MMDKLYRSFTAFINQLVNINFDLLKKQIKIH